ncbi:MAG: UbiA family prenyltransferase [Minicystis sp.]
MISPASVTLPREGGFVAAVRREIVLSWLFIRRDLSTTIIPSLIFIFTALKTSGPASMGDVARALGYGGLYFWLYIYSFCLGDQIVGVEEDRINKPDRPIPAGLVSIRGAYIRWFVAMAAFLAAGAALGVFKWALLWVVVSVLHNFGGWDRHWLTKNCVAMPLGNLAELAAAWEMARPLSPIGLRWLIVSPIFTFLTMSIQDFRDVAGDAAIGRRTLPMVLGDRTARIAVAIAHVVVLPVIHLALAQGPARWSLYACEMVIAALDFIIIARLLMVRTPRDDHRTYMLYTYWYCFILLSGLIVL